MESAYYHSRAQQGVPFPSGKAVLREIPRGAVQTSCIASCDSGRSRGLGASMDTRTTCENPKWRIIHKEHECGEPICLPQVAFAADGHILVYGECDKCGELYAYEFSHESILRSIFEAERRSEDPAMQMLLELGSNATAN